MMLEVVQKATEDNFILRLKELIAVHSTSSDRHVFFSSLITVTNIYTQE
jgi:hypothetical protein